MSPIELFWTAKKLIPPEIFLKIPFRNFSQKEQALKKKTEFVTFFVISPVPEFFPPGFCP